MTPGCGGCAGGATIMPGVDEPTPGAVPGLAAGLIVMLCGAPVFGFTVITGWPLTPGGAFWNMPGCANPFG